MQRALSKHYDKAKPRIEMNINLYLHQKKVRNKLAALRFLRSNHNAEAGQ